MSKHFLLIIAMVSLFACATAKKDCPTGVREMSGVKVEEESSVIEEDIPDSTPQIKGDDHNKLILEENEKPVLIKDYFPKKFSLKENEYTEVSLLPGDLAEFSFASSQERDWRIHIINDDKVMRDDGFFVEYFLCPAGQPNVFMAIGGKVINRRSFFDYESAKEYILKIVVRNESDHLILPLTILPAQYTNRNERLSAIEPPNR